jgi:hypothetical protein
MNVKELREFLVAYKDDMEIVNVRYSDYEIIKKSDFSIINGVDNDGWIMRSHPTMSNDNKSKEKSYLCIDGN